MGMPHAVRRMTNLAAALALAAALSGCASWSTFPPVAGGETLAPGLAPAPDVMGLALAYAHSKTDPEAPLVYNLPPGVSPGTWKSVKLRTGVKDARPMQPGDREVWSIDQVRLRGGFAEVDVVYLEKDVYQMVTVKLQSRPFEPYRPVYLQRWLVPVPTPTSNDPMLARQAPPAAEPEAPPEPTEQPASSSPTLATGAESSMPVEEPAAPTEPATP